MAVNLINDINLLYEIGSLRFVDRTWKQFLHTSVANDSEHTFRVCFIALILARHEKVKNEEKVLKMALIHDICESRSSDTNYLSKKYVQRNEKQAVKDMFSNTSLSSEAEELFIEYEERKTVEAKVVKDADLLDVDFELLEHISRGSKLNKEWMERRREIAANFNTKSAKIMWDALQKTDAQDWHIKAWQRK